jgi:hypothetical protein
MFELPDVGFFVPTLEISSLFRALRWPSVSHGAGGGMPVSALGTSCLACASLGLFRHRYAPYGSLRFVTRRYPSLRTPTLATAYSRSFGSAFH